MLRSFRRAATLVALAALGTGVACEQPVSVVDLAPRLLDEHAWAGGWFRIRVERAPAADAVLLVGVDTVAFSILDDSTLEAIAPQRTGLQQVRLIEGTGTTFLEAELRVYGWRDATVGPKVFGYPLPASVNAAVPIVFVNGESSLVRLDLRSGVVQPFAGSIHDPFCTRGAGPTPTEGLLILARRVGSGTSCVFALWQMSGPAPQLVTDSVPGGFRLTAQFDANHWLVSPGQHQVCLRSVQPAAQDCRQFEEMNGIRFSPRGDRSFMYYAWSSTNGVPIFSTATGDIAYTLQDASYSAGGAFTPGGDTLMMVTGETGSGAEPERLLLLNAVTGQHLLTIALPVSAEDVAVDPDKPFVYVFGWDSLRTAHVMVFGRPSMGLVGDMVAPHSEGFDVQPDSLCYRCDNRLFLDAGSRTLFLLGLSGREGRATLPSSIARFDLR